MNQVRIDSLFFMSIEREVCTKLDNGEIFLFVIYTVNVIQFDDIIC